MLSFTNINAVSPIPTQPFLWMAEYFSGGLVEYDLETGEPNNFKSIDKSKLVRFGLVGNNRKMWYEVVGGSFHIAGRNIGIAYETKDGKRYVLAGNGAFNMNDPISFKQGYIDISLGMGANKKHTKHSTHTETTRISGYYYGYKNQMKIEDVSFSFKPIVAIPMGKPAYIEVNLVADKDLDGKLIFIRNGKDFESFEGALQAGKTAKINWLIK